MLFCFLNSGFLTVILPNRPASQKLLTMGADTFFPTLVQLFSDVWSKQPSVIQAGDSNEIILWSCCFVYQPDFWSCFVLFPEVSLQSFWESLFLAPKKKNTLKSIFQKIFGHHHHHLAPPARISLTLSRHPFLSSITSGRSSRVHPVLAQSCCM